MARNEKGAWSFATKATGIFTALVAAAFVVAFIMINNGNGSISREGLMAATAKTGIVQEKITPQPTVQHMLVTAQPASTHGMYNVSDTNTAQYRFSLTVGSRIAFESDISQAVISDQDYSWTDVLQGISSSVHADQNIVFLDNLLSEDGESFTDLSAPFESVKAIKAAGFDTVVLGNENILDKGVDALINTAAHIRESGLAYAGIRTPVQDRIRLLTINGATMAIISYADRVTKTSAAVIEEIPGMVSLYSEEQAREDMLYARDHGAVFIAVFMHWGDDNAEKATDAQRGIASYLCACGANLIVGTRGCIPIAPEYITAPDILTGQMNTCLTAYATGSMMTENRENTNHISSYMLCMDISCNQGKSGITECTYVPVYIWRNTVNDVNRLLAIRSNTEPPDSMNTKQKEYMEHSLQYIRGIMKNSSIQERK